MKKQKNNHARSKQKRRSLRLKNNIMKVAVARAEKLIKDGVNVTGKVVQAVQLKWRIQQFEAMRRVGTMQPQTMNQRQRRKRARQTQNY